MSENSNSSRLPSEDYIGAVEVQIVRIYKRSSEESWRSSGNGVRESFHSAEALLLREFSSYRKEGICVIVRPKYNDPEKICMFYEWRSFNGEPFKRIDFGVGQALFGIDP